MNKLLIYYSYTGNGDIVAKAFEEKGYDLRRVERKKKLPKSFFFGIMTGGFLASIKHKDKLVNFDPDISQYQKIAIEGPIWNGRFSSPINTVLKSLDLKDKDLTFVFCAGSGEGKKALERVNKEYPSSKVIFLKEPKKYPDELEKLEGAFQ